MPCGRRLIPHGLFGFNRYLLLAMLARVTTRSGGEPIGQLSLNLFNLHALARGAPAAAAALAEAVRFFVPKCARLELDLNRYPPPPPHTHTTHMHTHARTYARTHRPSHPVRNRGRCPPPGLVRRT